MSTTFPHGFPWINSGLIPNVQPFTYSDAYTYADILAYLKRYLEALREYVNTLPESVNSAIEQMIIEVEDRISVMESEVQDDIAEMKDYVDDAIQSIINSSIQLQDSVMRGIIDDPESLSREKLDELYADKNLFEQLDTVVQGNTELLNKLSSMANPIFDLERANIHWSAVIGPVGLKTIESIFICEELDNTWFVSAAPPVGFVSEQESYSVYRLDAGGRVRETMTFRDGGHGTMFFVEYIGGQLYLWTSVYDYTQVGAGRYNYVRIPWTSGATYSFTDIAEYRVPALSGVYNLTNYDQYNRLVGVRRDNPSEVTRSLRVFTLDDIKSGDMSSPVHETTVTMETQYGVGQGSVFMHETNKWYFMFGDSNSNVQGIVEYDADTGEKGVFRNFSDIVRWNAQTQVTHAFYEPEGLTVHHTKTGVAHLIFGMSYGRAGARYAHAYSVDMGVTDDVFDFANTSFPGDMSNYNTDVTFSEGFSSDPTYPLAWWVENGYICFKGRVRGSLVAGDNRPFTMPSSMRPQGSRALVVGKQSTGLSPTSAVRADLSGTTGQLLVYLPTDDGGNSTWFSMDSVRAKLAN